MRANVFRSQDFLRPLGAFVVLCSTPAFTDEAVVATSMARSLAHLTVVQISKSPVPNFHQVEVKEKGAIFYVTANGAFAIAGDLYALGPSGASNLTEPRRVERRGMAFESIDPAGLVVYAPTVPRRALLYVFTNVDCLYCQTLHEDLGAYATLGIEIRYLAFPGLRTNHPTFLKTVSAWCSPARKRAINDLMVGKTIPIETCHSPVEAHVELGQLVGVTLTPTFVAEDGRMWPGYLPPTDVAEKLGLLE